MVDGVFSDSSAGDRFTVRSPEFFAAAYRHTPTVLKLEHYGKVKTLGNWEARPDSAAAKFGKGKTGSDYLRGAINLLHATYIGYHGDAREWLTDNPELTKELLNQCGYWLFPKSISLPQTLGAGETAPLTLNLENRGVAPPYSTSELRLRLSGDRASWMGVVDRTDRSWLPGEHDHRAEPTCLAGRPEARPLYRKPRTLRWFIGQATARGIRSTGQSPGA